MPTKCFPIVLIFLIRLACLLPFAYLLSNIHIRSQHSSQVTLWLDRASISWFVFITWLDWAFDVEIEQFLYLLSELLGS